MKKIECKIDDKTMRAIKGICKIKGYTNAELNRRAIDYYIENIMNSHGVVAHSLKELSLKLGYVFSPDTCGIDDNFKSPKKETIGSIMVNGRKDLKDALETTLKLMENDDIDKILNEPSVEN